jgi:hypothetical protein
VVYGETSKIVIDATRQLPEEGGQEVFPKSNREYLMEESPETMAIVEAKFGEMLKGWKRV